MKRDFIDSLLTIGMRVCFIFLICSIIQTTSNTDMVTVHSPTMPGHTPKHYWHARSMDKYWGPMWLRGLE